MSFDKPSEEFDLSSEEQRLAMINRRAFERAVAKATEQATQNVSQVHRRRLVRHTAIVTISIMAAVGAVIVLFISSNNGAQFRANSRYNCRIFTHISDDISQFVQTEANLRKQQQFDQKRIAALRPGALKKLLVDPQTVKLSKQSATAEKDTVHFWDTYIAPDLRAIAALNCQRAIR